MCRELAYASLRRCTACAIFRHANEDGLTSSGRHRSLVSSFLARQQQRQKYQKHALRGGQEDGRESSSNRGSYPDGKLRSRETNVGIGVPRFVQVADPAEDEDAAYSEVPREQNHNERWDLPSGHDGDSLHRPPGEVEQNPCLSEVWRID